MRQCCPMETSEGSPLCRSSTLATDDELVVSVWCARICAGQCPCSCVQGCEPGGVVRCAGSKWPMALWCTWCWAGVCALQRPASAWALCGGAGLSGLRRLSWGHGQCARWCIDGQRSFCSSTHDSCKKCLCKKGKGICPSPLLCCSPTVALRPFPSIGVASGHSPPLGLGLSLLSPAEFSE